MRQDKTPPKQRASFAFCCSLCGAKKNVESSYGSVEIVVVDNLCVFAGMATQKRKKDKSTTASSSTPGAKPKGTKTNKLRIQAITHIDIQITIFN
jgi:hypothetical protein